MIIALLGWGYLIWDKRPEFDDCHEDWKPDGPFLKLEFSRISDTRGNALSLVIDNDNGKECKVFYTISKRIDPTDTIHDLQNREGTIPKYIGCYFIDGSCSCQPNVTQNIKTWAEKKRFNVVVWTGLPSNFEEKKEIPFSIQYAILHLKNLPYEEKIKAVEYIERAPNFVDTPLRKALKKELWFTNKTSGK